MDGEIATEPRPRKSVPTLCIHTLTYVRIMSIGGWNYRAYM